MGFAERHSRAEFSPINAFLLRSMTDAPLYVSNSTVHNDLGNPYIKDVIQERSSKNHDRIEFHPNQLLQPYMKKQNNRRLKRRLLIDLK
jgi:hypothetical protein